MQSAACVTYSLNRELGRLAALPAGWTWRARGPGASPPCVTGAGVRGGGKGGEWTQVERKKWQGWQEARRQRFWVTRPNCAPLVPVTFQGPPAWAGLVRAVSGARADLPEAPVSRKARPSGKWPAALGPSKSEPLRNFSLGPDISLPIKSVWRWSASQIHSEPLSPHSSSPLLIRTPSALPHPSSVPLGPTWMEETEEAGRAWSAVSEPGRTGLGYKGSSCPPPDYVPNLLQ